jgi:hypothetical protein
LNVKAGGPGENPSKGLRKKKRGERRRLSRDHRVFLLEGEFGFTGDSGLA